MRLKLDENLGRHGAELLRQAEHEVTTVPEQHLCGATDAELIEVCSASQRRMTFLMRYGRLSLDSRSGRLKASSGLSSGDGSANTSRKRTADYR